MNAQFITSLAQIPAEQWDALVGGDYPFLRHRFLHGLEITDCTTAETGWQPCHLVLSEDTRPLAVLPLYLKSHSYGEYVFDWSWSQAWQQSGLRYYPKLVSAIPFTPATGPRLCVAPDLDLHSAWDHALAAIEQLARQQDLSSWHLLFPDESVSGYLETHGLPQRRTVQFHWFNEGYASFDQFLETFNSRKRKALRRERRLIAAQNLQLETRVGDAIRPSDWDFFHRCYQFTYARRSGHGGYLSKAFFTDIAAGMGDQVIMVVAREGADPVAASLFFRSSDTLYGRYWGCLREYDCLHFEACYYRGIDFCIEHGLQRFDPGAQGEHKIQRGFRPVQTYSNHWVADQRLAAAVEDFTRRERPHTEAYLREAATLLPFRQTVDP